MVIDRLENSGMYESLHPSMAKAFEFIREYGQNPLADGRYDVEGSSIYALVQSYATQPALQKKWESHRRYIDVQYICEGREAMLWAPMGALKAAGGYVPEKDFAGYEDGPSSALRCEAGSFVIFFPNDLHMPGCDLDGANSIKKIVIKIMI